MPDLQPEGKLSPVHKHLHYCTYVPFARSNYRRP